VYAAEELPGGSGVRHAVGQAPSNVRFVPEEEKYKLVREGVFHLTFLDRLIVKEIDGEKKTKYTGWTPR
jgi:hypothetical protein